jgi:uncharacterized protein
MKFLTTAAFLALAAPVLADTAAGVEKLNAGDVKGAAADFAAAYDAGDAEGAFYLGRLFELGLGTERDEMRAANLYSAAAEKGSLRAKTRLGLMYHEGRILLRDYAEGTKLLCEAADGGDADGQLNCGLALQAGRGVAADEAKAISYIEKAGAQGNILALNVLGQHYVKTGDTTKAATYLKDAADRGNGLAMFEYARLLGNGETPDDIGAYTFASLAIVRGIPAASDYLNELEARMSAEDVLAAQKAAKDWTASKIDAAKTNN